MSGFLDKVKAKVNMEILPKKLVAAVGAGALALAGIGLGLNSCGNHHTESPRTSVTQKTPSPVDSITPTSTPTPTPPSSAEYPPLDATEPPHPNPTKTDIEKTDVEEMMKPLKDWNYENIDVNVLDDKNASRDDLVKILDQFIENNYDNGEAPASDPVTKKTAWSATRIIRLIQMLSVDHSDEANYTRAMNLAKAMFNPEKTEELDKFLDVIRRNWAQSNPTSPTCKKEVCSTEARSLLYDYTKILDVSRNFVVVTNANGGRDSVVRFVAGGEEKYVPSSKGGFSASPTTMYVEVNTSNILHKIEVNEITYGIGSRELDPGREVNIGSL